MHWLNAFPLSNGISKTLSPSNILIGAQRPALSKKTIGHSSYAIVYTEIKNNMKTRGVPGIELRVNQMTEAVITLHLSIWETRFMDMTGKIPIKDEVILTG